MIVGTRGMPYIKPESSDMTDHFRPRAAADSRSRKWTDRPATMFPSRGFGATAALPRASRSLRMNLRSAGT